MKTIFLNRVWSLLLTICWIPQLQAQTATSSIFDLLTQQEGDTLRLDINLTDLLANRRSTAYFPAMVTAANGQSFPLEVRVRGKFRRKTCEIPPLKLKFSKKTLLAAGLDTLNEIKLVLPHAFDAKSEELILREYIAYRMYERLTPVCFRARLVRLQLTDNSRPKTRLACAILLEHEEQVAMRQRGQIAKVWELPKQGVNMDQAALAVLFEYLIGNTDWDMVSSRNMLFLQPIDAGDMLIMPYDFDFSGLVSAPYASPNSVTGLKNVRDRYLMAKGIAPESLRRAVQLMKDARTDLAALCKSDYLSKKASAQMVDYLTIFFDAVEHSSEVPAMLVSTKR